MRLDRKLHNADRRSWDEKVCINCGGNPSQQECEDHFYSQEEYHYSLIEELSDRLEVIENRGSYSQPTSKVKSVKKTFKPDLSMERKKA